MGRLASPHSRRIGRAVTGLSIALLSVSGFCAETSVETEKRECPCLYEARHVLDGHAFLPILTQSSAFSDSKVSLGLGIGQGNYSTVVNGVDRNVNLISLSPTLDVQVAILPRLAVYAGITGNIASGLNSESALIYGGSVRYSWTFGAIYELIRGQRDVLSVAFQVNLPHTFAVSPIETALQAQQAIVSSSNPNFVNSTVSTEYRPNLRYAHAFNAVLGVQAALGLDFRSTSTNGIASNGSLMTGAIGLSSDFDPWVSVPIGLTLNYSRNQIVSRSETNAQILGLGIWETFTHRFNAGAEIGKVWRNALNSTVGAVVVRTYYN